MIEQRSASDLERGDVVLTEHGQRRIERIDRCKSSRTDLHLVWQQGNVPLCIRPEAVVPVQRDVTVTIIPDTRQLESMLALASEAVRNATDFTDTYNRVSQHTVQATK